MRSAPIDRQPDRQCSEVKTLEREDGRPSVAGYAWGILALATCPCHLPLLLAVLAGTSVGAMIASHWVIASLALALVFGLSFSRALSMFRR